MINEEMNDIQILLKISKFDEHDKSVINKNIIRKDGKVEIDKDTFGLLKSHYLSIGHVEELINFTIKLFSNSSSFNMADYRYCTFIKPLLEHFNKKQLIELISAIDNNSQIYNRVNSYSDNNEILKKCKHLLDSDFNFGQYYNFVFDEAALEEIS